MPWMTTSRTVVMGSASLSSPRMSSLPEIGGVDLVPRQAIGRALQRHPAFAEAVHPVRYLHRLDDVLLHHHDRGALRLDRGKSGIDVADDHRRQAERYLVAKQQFRVRHQRAA